MRDVRGYIAVQRSIFDHKLFAGAFSRRDAWLWLIARAAWKPSIQKVKRGALTVGRGELAATVRGLAQAWGWSPAAVQRFLGALKREKMIRVCCTDTSADTLRSTRGMVITVCNYEKFQATPKLSTGEPIHSPIRQIQKTLLLPIPGSRNQSNQSKIDTEVKIGEAKRPASKKEKPRDGAQSKDGRLIWADFGSEIWKAYAADYKAVTSSEIFPDAWDQTGHWFKKAGEAELPLPQRGFG